MSLRSRLPAVPVPPLTDSCAASWQARVFSCCTMLPALPLELAGQSEHVPRCLLHVCICPELGT